jgi:hypothetical protein
MPLHSYSIEMKPDDLRLEGDVELKTNCNRDGTGMDAQNRNRLNSDLKKTSLIRRFKIAE